MIHWKQIDEFIEPNWEKWPRRGRARFLRQEGRALFPCPE